MHATAHAVIIDRRYIGPLNSLYSFHSRSKTIVELIVAVDILEVFEENDPQEVKISKNTLPWFVLQLYWHWKRMVWLSMTGCRLKLRFSQQRAPTV